jgi:hypothetical protein
MGIEKIMPTQRPDPVKNDGVKVSFYPLVTSQYAEEDVQDVTRTEDLNDIEGRDKTQYTEYRSLNISGLPALEAIHHQNGHRLNYITNLDGVKGHKWHDPKAPGPWHNSRLALDDEESFDQVHFYPEAHGIAKGKTLPQSGGQSSSFILGAAMCVTTFSMALLGSMR